ncbi:MAG: LysM peptidoglycan-binding domain-containing protein [Gemmatimonadales bacterium]
MPDDKQPKADFSDVEGGSSSTAPPAGGRTYTVVKGDSLSKIAKQFYGNASQWKRIYEANKDVIKNPDLIYPGQTFKIPEG